ncbi:PHP domain-containing protein [Anaerorhabdus sp.]|uniref:PHP domain-containing protein n=1 Tax=Anaerorhabdus sp. TaxID=1872524 RepID=UPI002FC6526E
MKCDLHCHSFYSFDSTQSVEDILQRANKAQIDVLAICDHNTYEGSLEAQKQNEIEIISGIEIDCFCLDAIIHLTAYGMDLNNQEIHDLKQAYVKELDRIAEIRLKLIEERFQCKLDVNKIQALTHGGYPYTNVEIEQVLLEDVQHPELEIYQTGEKSKSPIANFYWDHLAIGKWGYVEMMLPDYRDIIAMIHRLKGVAICAHPKVTIGREKILIDALIESNIDGFEAYCSYHNQEDARFYKALCEEKNLCMTVGSDFHGKTKPNIQLGDTGYEGDCAHIVEDLKRRIKEKQG